jgi:hypothetical protein
MHLTQPRTSRAETLKRIIARVAPIRPNQRKLTPSQAFATRNLQFITKYK